ncbi:MAG: hypothetical protein H0V29_05755 [Thermoleophilaceae bacterium]|nr:hypothetical protein [Thermoleophilaceae bacterium]
MTRKARWAGLTAAAAILAVPGAASAGNLALYTCATPSNGTAAPTDGWTLQQSGYQSGFSVNNNSCASGSDLFYETNPPVTYGNGWNGGYRYTAPANLPITGVRLWRWWSQPGGPLASGGNFYLRYYTNADNPPLESGFGSTNTASSAGTSTRFAVQNQHDVTLNGPRTHFGFSVACDSVSSGYCANSAPARYHLQGARFTVLDSDDPTSSSVSGSLATPGPHAGTDLISYDSADIGAGVYRSLIEVDGTVVKVDLVDTNGGACQDAGEDPASIYEFRSSARPCKLTKQVTQSFDTTTVGEGSHRLRVLIEDASGNRSVVHQTNAFAVDNVPSSGGSESPLPRGSTPVGSGGGGSAARGEANGDGASARAKLVAFARATKTAVITRFGRPVELTGRLVDERRQPIAGAVLQVQSQLKLAGAPFEESGSVRTDKEGRFRFTAPSGPSRTVRFAYRAFANDREFTDLSDVTVGVRAGARLKGTPRKVRNGDKVRFSGRLLGGPYPARGVLVDLQARVGRRWRTFQVMRTRRDGTYQHIYRFTRTTQTLTYAFRARARSDSNYPYELGTSNRTRVKVIGG